MGPKSPAAHHDAHRLHTQRTSIPGTSLLQAYIPPAVAASQAFSKRTPPLPLLFPPSRPPGAGGPLSRRLPSAAQVPSPSALRRHRRLRVPSPDAAAAAGAVAARRMAQALAGGGAVLLRLRAVQPGPRQHVHRHPAHVSAVRLELRNHGPRQQQLLLVGPASKQQATRITAPVSARRLFASFGRHALQHNMYPGSMFRPSLTPPSAGATC